MPHCTLEIGLKLVSRPNNRGWVLGQEVTGYDRTILMHDNRFDGHVAAAVGHEWQSGLGAPPLGEWLHVVAVFAQGGDSYVFVNGRKSHRTIATNRPSGGQTTLWLGRPHHGGHWCDCWVKMVRVFDECVGDDDIERTAKQFLAEMESKAERSAD